MNDFIQLKDIKYREKNTSLEVQNLYLKIIRGAENGPFLTSDLANFLIIYCFKYNNPSEIEIETKVDEAIRFFRKGVKNEIYELIIKELNGKE